jgi:hypothetical protein
MIITKQTPLSSQNKPVWQLMDFEGKKTLVRKSFALL